MKNAISVPALRLKLGLLHARHGVWPFIAAGLAALSLACAAALIPGQLAATAQARDSLARVQQALAEQANMPAAQRLSHAQSLARVLSDQRDTDAQIRQLLELAASMNVTVVQADYRRIADAQHTWSEFQISLPVRADYLVLRQFLFQAMAQMPSLSLEQLIIKHEQPSAPQVDAQLLLSLWQKPADSPNLASAGER
ncbi:hypothetical protein [Uliginosibacterium sediminicola]|uniref:Uncharacterized protein n=1 Tax=Uliginosibacterium sediminicola TaxID=2024550 RepID=A0ABU9Z0T8_9RHOO